VRLVTPLHMTRDARWFAAAPGPGLVPLWEAKHAGLLDHRGGARARFRYWVPRTLVEDRYADLAARGWLAGYRNVTTADSPRTLLPTALPVAGVGNSLPLVHAPRLPLLLAALASLPVDHLVRQKHAGANLNFFKLEQVALPPPEAYDAPAPWDPRTTVAAWVLDRFARAHAWDDDLAGLAAELAGLGVPVPVPARAAQVAAAERVAALADLDAAHAVLLGWDRSDLAHVLTAFPALRARDPIPSMPAIFVVSWTSMRGMVSLAAALALPLVTPFRAELVLITVTVIMVTLVLQGMTLLPLFGRLHFQADPAPAAEESHARAEAHRSALEHLADLADEPWVTREQLKRMESDLHSSRHTGAHGAANAGAEIYRRIRLGTVRAKRRALVRLRNEGAISDEVLLDLESELDYEALRLGGGEERDR